MKMKLPEEQLWSAGHVRAGGHPLYVLDFPDFWGSTTSWQGGRVTGGGHNQIQAAVVSPPPPLAQLICGCGAGVNDR